MEENLAPVSLPPESVTIAVRRAVRTHVLGRARRLAQRMALALQQWISPLNNPFLARAMRVEGRKHRPILTLLGPLFIAAALNAGLWLLWDRYYYDSYMWRAAIRNGRSPFSPAQLPIALGGNYVGLAAILTAAVSAVAILYATRARASYLLRQELLKSTLPQLQLLPIAEERWVWLMSAHPAFLSMMIGLCGFPVYFLAVATGLWSLLDIIGLMLVFLLLGQANPTWQPVLWQQGARGAQKIDAKAIQASLKRANEGVVLSQMTHAQQLEHQRRVQRIMSGAETVAPAAEETTVEPEKKKERGATGRAGNFGRGVGTWIAIQFAFSALGGGRFSALWTTSFGRALRTALPESVVELLPGFVLTWPLILARLILAPLPFFAFSLPPLLLLVPIVIGLRCQSVQTLASAVSASETFWTERRARRRRSVGTTLWFLFAALLIGYGWRALIVDGDFATILSGAIASPDWALAALWTVALVAGTVIAGTALEKPFAAAQRGELTLPDGWRKAFASMIRALGLTLLTYFGFCWLGGFWGGSEAWLARLAPTLLTGGAFLLFDFGSAAVEPTLPQELRSRWKMGRTLWFVLPIIEVMLRAFYGFIHNRPFGFEQAPHVVLSPFVTLFALFRVELSVPAVAWWLGPLLQGIAGGACLAIAGAATFREKSTPEFQESVEKPASGFRRVVDILLAPIFAFGDLMVRVWNWFVRLGRRISAFFTHWNDAIVARAVRWDNPIFLAEVRTRTRRQHWSAQWMAAVVGGLFIFIMVSQPWSLRGGNWIPAAASSLQGWGIVPGAPVNSLWQSWGRSVAYVVLGAAWLLLASVFSETGRAFDRERANGTQVFLYLTPMHDRELLLGKLAPSFIHAAGLSMAFIIPLLCGCLVALAGGNFAILVVSLFGQLFLLSSMLFIGAIQMLFAVRAVKPGEGSGKAALALLVVEGVLAAGAIFWMLQSQSEGPVLCGIFTAGSIIHVVLAALVWKLALWSLGRKRYGDVTGLGKGLA
ncbi:MAG TPA: hypothetical protein VF719_02430 [Abditibacteriaceae bacterium]